MIGSGVSDLSRFVVVVNENPNLKLENLVSHPKISPSFDFIISSIDVHLLWLQRSSYWEIFYEKCAGKAFIFD